MSDNVYRYIKRPIGSSLNHKNSDWQVLSSEEGERPGDFQNGIHCYAPPIRLHVFVVHANVS